MEQMVAACGLLVASAGLLVIVETHRFLRCRVLRWCPHHRNPGLIGGVADALADGLSQADFERSERKGRPLSDAQKLNHRNAMKGRCELAIRRYVAALGRAS